MTKRIKKHDEDKTPTEPPMAIDKTHALLRDDGPILLGEDTKPMRIGSANAVIACPTCGTSKAGNRCDVCGHQEHDT
jgi:hypothetical protein